MKLPFLSFADRERLARMRWSCHMTYGGGASRLSLLDHCIAILGSALYPVSCVWVYVYYRRPCIVRL